MRSIGRRNSSWMAEYATFSFMAATAACWRAETKSLLSSLEQMNQARSSRVFQMADSGFAKTSEAEQQLLTPQRAGWPLWPWLLVLVVVAVFIVVRSGRLKPEPEARGERDP